MTSTLDLQQEIAAMLHEMEAAEPPEIKAADPFACDVLEENAGHTMNMWRITYSTHHGEEATEV